MLNTIRAEIILGTGGDSMLEDLDKVVKGLMTVRDFANKYQTGINKTRRAKKCQIEARKQRRLPTEDEIKSILYPED